MKMLQRVRLINWHRFPNETIEFGPSVLISGENGAGKSTILDAIQFVVTCSKANFNKAAHEKGKRSLNSYIRCKTGQESHPYERTGELSAHICLEFRDDSRNSTFLIGVVMDSSSEDKEPNTAWYLMENTVLRDELFFKEKQVKSISAFRSSNKGIRNWCPTIGEAKKMILSRFGRLDEKFFALIPKAMAFKPIQDIKDFVYSYVLDAKEVNIESLRENVRSYQDLERMLEDVKRRIEELEIINAKEKDVEKLIRLDHSYEYYLARIEEDLLSSGIETAKKAAKIASIKEQEQLRSRDALLRQRDEKDDTIMSLKLELQGDENFKALSELEKKKTELETLILQDQRETDVLKKSAKKAAADAEKLLEVLAAVPEESQEKPGELSAYAELLGKLDALETIYEIQLIVERIIDFKNLTLLEIQKSIARLQMEMQLKKQEIAELDHKIRELKQKRLVYPKDVDELKLRIRDEFAKLGRSSEVRVLCELLEISNAAWQNAVEGYLNTQRFYLIVDPEDFDIAISVYDRMREQKKVYGVGLINTGKLDEYEEVPEGSLAEVVVSKNVYARRYINMVLGKVHRCSSYQELKQYPIAITRQCMRYQNHVVSAIRPEIYETPYIGAEAIRQQLFHCEAAKVGLEEQYQQLRSEENRYNKEAALLATASDIDVKYRLHYLELYKTHRKELFLCLEAARKLKENTTIIQKQIHLEELEAEKKQILRRLEELAIEIGRCREKVENEENKASELSERLEVQKQAVAELADRLFEEYEDYETDYLKLIRNRDLLRIKENYELARKQNQTRRANVEGEMIKVMQAYKSAHDFGAADSLAGYPEFASEYDKLKNSQLLDFEEKVHVARNAAEEEFREQFLSKIQENIKEARQEFRELNRALSEISFRREQYEFLYEPKSNMKKYYSMIMDDRNLAGGESIFTSSFMADHKEVIEDLFEKLALDDEDTQKTLEYYTDYRTYMEYDIKIMLPDGNYMLYSKVSAEKSGGETQSPFYITVAASFIQLYKNSIGGDAVGLMMMDEAFNNMDDERMSGVLEFLTGADLQLIIAAPPGKIQEIGRNVNKVLLTMQDGKYSFIEDFTNEAVR